jgi:muramoyltetrapeptide carboxypeptidase
VDPERLAQGEDRLRRAGFRTWRRDDLLARLGYLAGDDDRRADELMQLVEDPSIDGIVCARGGYGCDRILERLDPGAVCEAAKPLVGYSDVTALLLWQERCAGLAGFHGPMLELGDELDPVALDQMLSQLTGEVELPLALQGTGRGGGRGEGRLVGGSLTMLAASIGTPWEVDAEGAILLLEEVNERPYRIDRMLQQLRISGRLAGVVGIGFGNLSTCLDDRYGSKVEQVVEELASSLGLPCVTELPFGHDPCNVTWPVGARATIDGNSGELRILELGVEEPT